MRERRKIKIYKQISKISHTNVKTKRVVKAPSRSQYNEGYR